MNHTKKECHCRLLAFGGYGLWFRPSSRSRDGGRQLWLGGLGFQNLGLGVRGAEDFLAIRTTNLAPGRISRELDVLMADRTSAFCSHAGLSLVSLNRIKGWI